MSHGRQAAAGTAVLLTLRVGLLCDTFVLQVRRAGFLTPMIVSGVLAEALGQIELRAESYESMVGRKAAAAARGNISVGPTLGRHNEVSMPRVLHTPVHSARGTQSNAPDDVKGAAQARVLAPNYVCFDSNSVRAGRISISPPPVREEARPSGALFGAPPHVLQPLDMPFPAGVCVCLCNMQYKMNMYM
jgi:hypothetical protein